MGAVNEAQLPEGEGDILLRVVGDTAYPALHLRDGLRQQVGVIARRNGGGKGVQPQLEVAGGMGRPSIFTCNVAVVTHGVALERLSHTWHVSAVRKARQSPRVILIV